MPLQSGFPNYYELLDIPVTATPAEVRAGHVRAAARDSSLSHQKLCNEALAILENHEIREEYDQELREWNKKQLEQGTTKTNTAIRTIQEVCDAIDSADRCLQDADEIIFNSKFGDQTQLKVARREVHRYCRSAVEDAGRVRKWSREVLEFCEEADRYVAEFQYLMKPQARNLEAQIRKAERDARDAAKHVQEVVEKAKECEDEVDRLLSAAPLRANPVKVKVGSTAKVVTDTLSWTKNALELTLNIIKYISILFIIGLVLYFAVKVFG